MERGTFTRIVRFAVIALAVSACGTTAVTDTTSPPPATEAETKIFCERYEQVRDQDYQTKYESLAEVAPAEIRGALVRAAANPGPTEDDSKIEAFLERCE